MEKLYGVDPDNNSYVINKSNPAMKDYLKKFGKNERPSSDAETRPRRGAVFPQCIACPRKKDVPQMNFEISKSAANLTRGTPQYAAALEEYKKANDKNGYPKVSGEEFVEWIVDLDANARQNHHSIASYGCIVSIGKFSF